MNIAPSHPFHSIQEWDDTFLALFPHRHDYIWAPHPQLNEKPSWQTERRHPLSDRLIRQGSYLYGVRFGAKTNYLLLDLDRTSLYHPQRDPFAIDRLVAALEPLGLVRYLACTSSYSGGIHLYFPFAQAQESYKLARVVQVLLENAGFVFAPGHLELLPNDRGFVDGMPALYAGHRLPLQAGSYLLNADFAPIWSHQTTFVQQWQAITPHNHLDTATLKRVLKVAKRKKYRLSGKANKFLNDLTTEIYQGWTDCGQTNRLLGRIALYCYIFWHTQHNCTPLSGNQLVHQIVEVAKSLPGYTEFCRHQHELKERAAEWASCVESSRYYPYGQKTTAKETLTAKPPASTWHQDKKAEARERIRQAIAHLLTTNTLPAKTTARFYALTGHGIGGQTLYRHKDLWHPEHLQAQLQPVEPPPSPPKEDPRRVESAPECPNLLLEKSSNTALGLLLSDRESAPNQSIMSISSNTQTPAAGIAAIKQRLADMQALQEYKKAAQHAQWQQRQLQGQQHLPPTPEYVAKMQRWLESGEPILVAEAKVFFNGANYQLRSP